ncbi:MAG: hypothetical protein GC149_16400 [Gammaproteobacteria bacterium]|nr:hypothetical protein [Gammaproteobacteria bacterium]
MYNELSEAAENGDLEQVSLLLANGEDVNSFDALPLAAANGHLNIVTYLLKHGANVNQTGEHGRTALHNAAENGHLDIVKLLLKHRAACDTQDRGYLHTSSPLTTVLWKLHEHRYEEAVARNYIKIIKALLKGGADPYFVVHSSTSDGLPSQVVAYELAFMAEDYADAVKNLFDTYTGQQKHKWTWSSLFRKE